ncbi:MAG: hypothetical protein ABIQ01_01935 [Pseudolysinimonas sp.]
MGAKLLGTAAPDFTMRGTRISGGTAERMDFRLSEHRGNPVVIAFSSADPTEYAGWGGLAADVWAFTAEDAEWAGYDGAVYIIDPEGLVRWAHPSGDLPSAADIRGQLLLLLPGPMGGTFQLPPPPG